MAAFRLDRRLSKLAAAAEGAYTRYADDLTFSLPEGHKGKPNLKTLMGLVAKVVAAEGFRVNPEKTRVARSGGRQKVTGLVINGEGRPRVPRKLRRQLRAAIHNLKNGKPLKEVVDRGYTPHIDDGVVLNAAPLLSLLPSWPEAKKAWQELEAGEYDWAQQAMEYWPERVKKKCKTNKSFAIAHGLA